MIGCMILGGLAGFLAVRLWHHRHHGGGHGCRSMFRGRHHHHHDERWDEDAPWERGFAPRGRGWAERIMHMLSGRLQTTPKQERELSQALESMMTEAATARDEGKKTRADLAAALRKPVFDEVLMGELYARHDDFIEKMRKSFVGFGAKVHETLEEDQRERLATLLERGGGFFRRGAAW